MKYQVKKSKVSDCIYYYVIETKTKKRVNYFYNESDANEYVEMLKNNKNIFTCYTCEKVKDNSEFSTKSEITKCDDCWEKEREIEKERELENEIQ